MENDPAFQQWSTWNTKENSPGREKMAEDQKVQTQLWEVISVLYIVK